MKLLIADFRLQIGLKIVLNAMSTNRSIDVTPVPLEAILAMRDEHRREMNCQVVHDSWHARGFTDSFALRVDGQIVGYGSVGGPPGGPRNMVKEFFVFSQHRGCALPLFYRLVAGMFPCAIIVRGTLQSAI